MNNIKSNNNRSYTANGESTWTDNTAYRNSRYSKYHQAKNPSKYYANKATLDLSYQHTTEIDIIASESTSAAFSPSSESNSSETTTPNEVEIQETTCQKTMEVNNVYDQGIINNNGCYINNNNNVAYNEYDYDYQQTSVQQQSQYYIYQPNYQDYNQCQNISGSPLNTSFTQPPASAYYPAYQHPVPSYLYDTQAAYSQCYSPIQPNNNMPHTFHQTPGNNQQINHMPTTPQQQPSFLLPSYQTPQPQQQQLSNQNLYIQTSNITPPTSLSPNDSNPLPSSTTTERSTDCHSPNPGQQMPSNLNNQTPVHNPMNPYMYQMTPNYSPLPLTPQTYQCASPLPTAQYMMYNPPPMLQNGCGSPYQTQTATGGFNSPMMSHTPFNNNNGHSNQGNNKCQGNNGKHGRNYGNKWNNNKRGFNNQKYSYPTEQTTQQTYSPDESQFMSSPVIPPMPSFEQPESNVLDNSSTTQMPMYPTSPYCDPQTSMPNTEAILTAAYNNYNNIDSYGDDYEPAYDNDHNGPEDDDDKDENLACQVCRGRRMCFCYFLKVRYYKFPSFFDLVDHQYKKWRKTMAAQNQNQNLNMNPMQRQNMNHMNMNTSVNGK